MKGAGRVGELLWPGQHSSRLLGDAKGRAHSAGDLPQLPKCVSEPPSLVIHRRSNPSDGASVVLGSLVVNGSLVSIEGDVSFLTRGLSPERR